MHTLPELIELSQKLFEEKDFIQSPKELYEPIDYTLHLGGKRVRPVMLMAAYEMFGGQDLSEVQHAALGIETFHNFTLLHDDLMDKSPLRRNQPTVYCKWDENTAILSGDAMFALAWNYMLQRPHPQLHSILQTFGQTALEVCEGQQYDMNFEKTTEVSISDYMEMIRLKTAVLLAGALKIGALYAGGTADDIEHLYRYGIHMGLAFQLQDDLLDAYGTTEVLGKPTGNDIRDNKKTFLYLSAIEAAPTAQKAVLKQLFRNTPAEIEQKVNAVMNLYDQLGIRRKVETEIALQFAQASTELQAISLPEANKETLSALANKLLGRNK